MVKYKVYIAKMVEQVWEVEAESAQDAKINFDLTGELVSEKEVYHEFEVEED